MDSSLVSFSPNHRRGKPWFLILGVFLCLSGLISLPLAGVHFMFALLRSPSWPGIVNSLEVYGGSALLLTYMGCLAEGSMALVRHLSTVHFGRTIQVVETSYFVKVYYALAVGVPVNLLRKWGFTSHSSLT
jgi:hypothetical protein